VLVKLWNLHLIQMARLLNVEVGFNYSISTDYASKVFLLLDVATVAITETELGRSRILFGVDIKTIS
jgi:hypothetical protein